VNRTLAEAFRAAGCGVAYALRTQRNLRIQCAVAAGVLALALVVDASATEVALLAVACGLVLGLELVNTAVEVLVDGLWPQPSEAARRVKDTSAAAVVLGIERGARVVRTHDVRFTVRLARTLEGLLGMVPVPDTTESFVRQTGWTNT